MRRTFRQWFGQSPVAGTIKCIDIAIFAAYMLTFHSDLWCKVSIARHLGGCQRPDRSDGCVFSITTAHSISSSQLSRCGGRAVVVLIGIWLGIDGVNPIYEEKRQQRCVILLTIHMRSVDVNTMNMQVLYTLPQSVGIAGGRPSSSYYLVGSHADNLFYLDPHHTRATVPLQPPTQTQTQTPTTERERERGIPIRQASPERVSVSPLPPAHH